MYPTVACHLYGITCVTGVQAMRQLAESFTSKLSQSKLANLNVGLTVVISEVDVGHPLQAHPHASVGPQHIYTTGA